MILVEEVARKLTHILTILELGCSDLTGLFEVAVFIKSLVNFILYLGFQVQVFQQPWNHLADFLRFGLPIPYNLFFNCFFDGPEHIGILDFFED